MFPNDLDNLEEIAKIASGKCNKANYYSPMLYFFKTVSGIRGQILQVSERLNEKYFAVTCFGIPVLQWHSSVGPNI